LEEEERAKKLKAEFRNAKQENRHSGCHRSKIGVDGR
jgi:hypothetical protein